MLLKWPYTWSRLDSKALVDGLADGSFNYNGFLGHETKFGLEWSKRMIKGFQLLDNFMLIITTESPDIRCIYSAECLQADVSKHFQNLEKILQMSIVFSQTPSWTGTITLSLHKQQAKASLPLPPWLQALGTGQEGKYFLSQQWEFTELWTQDLCSGLLLGRLQG